MSNYVISTSLPLPIGPAIEKFKEVLMQNGLGIVSDVDVAATIEKKLGATIAPYRILGACNPALARKLIEAAPTAGALLPCTVVAREVDGITAFDFMDPKTVLTLEQHPVAAEIAELADEKIRNVVKSLS